MYISEIAWRPHNPTSPKILILGESHYDEDIPQGEKNKHITREVVEYMLDEAPEWKTFFYNIAASFGYRKDKEGVRDFYNKVYFANYVEESCGKGSDNQAANFIWGKGNTKGRRDYYNKAVFEFCNEEHISIICVFSKLAYGALPKLDEDYGEKEDKCTYSSNYEICKTYYKQGASRDRIIKLENDLTVYGFNHSTRGGYRIPNQFLRDELKHHDILKQHVSPRNN